MRPAAGTLAGFLCVLLLSATGCATSGGSSGGWVVVKQPESPPPPPAARKKSPPDSDRKARGQERAARNHMRSAYKFLQKGKPDHAIRELEKARNAFGDSFWFHYYLGGAYYLKGMYEKAGDSWKTGNRYTNDRRLRSRLRTCQSFAANFYEGDRGSIGFLRAAIDLDDENRQARDLLKDLSGSDRNFSQGRADVQVGFVRPSGRGSAREQGNDDLEGRMPDDDGAEGYGRSKYGKDKEKVDRKTGRSKEKKEKPKKIRDKDLFREYFLIEMD